MYVYTVYMYVHIIMHHMHIFAYLGPSSCFMVFVSFIAGQTFTTSHKSYDKSLFTSSQGSTRSNSEQLSEHGGGSREHSWWDSLNLPGELNGGGG